MFAKTFSKYKDQEFISMAAFSDGLPFAQMINRIDFCKPVIH